MNVLNIEHVSKTFLEMKKEFFDDISLWNP